MKEQVDDIMSEFTSRGMGSTTFQVFYDSELGRVDCTVEYLLNTPKISFKASRKGLAPLYAVTLRSALTLLLSYVDEEQALKLPHRS